MAPARGRQARAVSGRGLKSVRRPLSEKAQQALDEALEQLMATQVCDAALDGSERCSNEVPCQFHRTHGPAPDVLPSAPTRDLDAAPRTESQTAAGR